MVVRREDKFEMTIDDHDTKFIESELSSFNKDRLRNDARQWVGTPSRSSTGRWTQEIDEKKLIRKIDWSIVPVLMAAYFLQFLDKVVYNYANVMGMQRDIKMHGNQFSWGATGFFLAYALAELPQSILIQKFPVTKVLGANILCWGIVLCGTAAVQTPSQMLAARALLGAFESVITPALVMITSAWYKRNEAAPRFGLWYSGLGLGQIIGGAISFAAQHHQGSLAGWRIMFLSIGIVNCLIAAAVWWLPGTPEEAKFLTPAEKEAIAQRLHDDHGGVGTKKLRIRSIFETFLDLQTWLLCLLTILTVIPSGLITTYSAFLIKEFGYNSSQAALLNMPSGIITILALLSSTLIVRQGYQRWVAIIMAVIPTLIGTCLVSFLPRTSKAGLLTGIYLVNFVVAPYAIILSAAGSNYRGYTRKIAGSAIIAASFSIANIISPQTFQDKDRRGGYMPAKYTLVATTASCIVVAVALRLLYGYRNRRAEELGEPAMSSVEAKAVRGNFSLEFSDPGYRSYDIMDEDLAQKLAALESLSDLDRSSFPDEATRQRALKAARELVQRLESVWEKITGVVWIPPSRHGLLLTGIDIGLFEALEKAPSGASLDELVETLSVKVDKALLRRILNFLANTGDVKAIDDKYAPTLFSTQIATAAGVKGAIKRAVDMNKAALHLPIYLQKIGYKEPADAKHGNFYDTFGTDMFTHNRQNPERGKQFNDMMTVAVANNPAPPWYTLYPITQLLETYTPANGPLLIDVGGGVGTLLTRFRNTLPEPHKTESKLILQDTPAVIAQATSNPHHPLPSNIEANPHDFFTPQPIKGARAYYLRAILHDWPDTDCRTILRHLHAAMMKGYSTLLVDERVVPETGVDLLSAAADVTMMVNLDAKERTAGAPMESRTVPISYDQ
ncbi:hypothetical protein FKW77_008078 [Venturia effusa]|uniref:Major facilitator superfamily (MFS) profile domain-containing protein n=1 Tax=Venturia effusa TaxID=50376 RepID=A0A517L1Q8_9PEZI|nr:hypothetical protein FKW77_008078 [Venturia effusa]